jgi:ligand-binding sensor domain-containing protein/serine phosphatase RsbU (regulator of sigma subunit)
MITTKTGFFLALLGILFCCVSVFGQKNFSLDANSQNPQYQIDAWNAETDDFSNAILSILQGRDGYIWVGTFDGFYKFDGINFTRIDADKKHGEAFSNYTFWSILEDKNQNIWLGTNGGGIIFYDFKEKSYKKIEDKRIHNDIVISLFEDSQGVIWGGTRTHLIRIENQNIEIIDLEGFAKINVHSFAEDKNGVLWLGTRRNGLVGIKDRKVVKQYNTENGLPSQQVYALLYDRNNQLWLGTTKGLYTLENEQFISKPLNSIKGNPFPIVHRIFQKEDQNIIWVGTYNGLVRLDGDNQSFIPNLPHNRTGSIDKDGEGNIWVGTYSGGLAKLKKTKFLSYTTEAGLINPVVNTIIEGQNNDVWIGTNQGISLLKDGKFTNFTTKDGLAGARIRDLFLAKDKVWIATYGGVSYYQNGKMHLFEGNSALKDVRIRAVYYDENTKDLWLGSTQGLHRYTSKKEMFVYGDKELGNSNIMSINHTLHGLAIGTDGGGLILYQEEKFKRITTDEGLGGNVIFDVYGDEQDNLWISTNGGLTLMQGDKMTVFKMSDGLCSNTTFQTLEDDEHKLWFTSNKYIYNIPKKELLDFADGKIIKFKPAIFTSNDGLPSNLTGAAKGMKTKDGWLAFPCLKGAAFIKPSEIKLNPNPPIIYIEEISLDGELTENLTSGDDLNILPDTRHINISYTALSHSAPQKVQFKYRLYPFEQEWIQTTAREVNYTSLPVGKYTFELMAANGDGIWTQKAFEIKLQQKGHLYKNPVFIIFFSAFLAIIGLLIYRYRVIQYEKSKQKLEGLVLERTSEIQQLVQEVKLQAKKTARSYAKVSNSIRYAKRIQDAILQDDVIFETAFSDFFVFLRAKDVVSGDFYWSTQEDNKIIVAVGDCTGHGVPGAFMTILGTSTLDKIVHKDAITDPAQILQKLDKEIYAALDQKNELNPNLREGMDISICVFDYQEKKFYFAGAKSRAFYFQNEEMIVLDGDKTSIGSQRKHQITFNTQEFDFQKGNKLYLFSDGLPDQFGGKNNRKYLTRRLKVFTNKIRPLTMKEQEQKLIEELKNWQGDRHQIDDIIFVGIEL